MLAPLRVEAVAAKLGLHGDARVVRTGMGPAAARKAASRAAGMPGDRVVIAGVCGALDPALRPGDIVLASELPGAEIRPEDPEPIAAALRERGITTHVGPILTADRLLTGPARAQAHAEGAIAADLESRWLAEGAAGRPLTVVRAVVDTPAHELGVSLMTARDGIGALRSLSRALAVIGTTAVAAIS